MSRINFHSLKYKILSLPVCFIILMIPIMSTFLINLNQQKDVIAVIKEEQISRMEKLTNILYDFTVKHEAILSILAPADGILDEEKIYEEGSDLMDEIQILETSLIKSAGDFNDEQPDIVKTIQHNLPIYRQSFLNAVEMSTVDAKLAAKKIAGANSSYAKFTKAVLKLVNVATMQNRDELSRLNQMANDSFMISSGLAILTFIVIVILSVIVIPWVMLPIQRITLATRNLADGDLSVDIVDNNRKDEIGNLARSLQVFKENAICVQKMESDKLKAEEKAKLDKQKTMNEMAKKFEDNVQGLIKIVVSSSNKLQQTAESMKTNSDEVSLKSNIASKSAETTSSNVNTVADSTEEMLSSIKDISSQVTQSTSLINEAVTKADSAGISAVSLEEGTIKMGDIISLIQDIAAQINLLALNATIESARAGEAGKGFAVVASEVKNLASQTTSATEEISQQIASIQSVSSEVSGSLVAIKESIDNVNQYSGGISVAVEEQSATTTDIANSMKAASHSTKDINDNIAGIQSASLQASNSSNELLEESTILSQKAGELSTEISSFLVSIREN